MIRLYLGGNLLCDASPLLDIFGGRAAPSIDTLDIDLVGNPLNDDAYCIVIPSLEAAGWQLAYPQPATPPLCAPALVVEPTTENVTAEAGMTTFPVRNDGAGTMPWNAFVTSGESWLSITSGTSGIDDALIAVTYSKNTGKKSRTGTIQVSADGADNSPVTITVVQSAASKGGGGGGGKGGGGGGKGGGKKK